MNILEEIAAKRKLDIECRKQMVPLKDMRKQAHDLVDKEFEGAGGLTFPFKQALAKKSMSFICEVKKASPSKGVIAEEFPYLKIAKEYEAAGASAISVLTEPEYFQGNDNYLQEIAEAVEIPVLRKDFIIDVYQIYEAKVLGASAVLLICSLLNDECLNEFLKVAHEIGMDALVEAHDEEEVKRALAARADIVGVNNRDLKTFTVDIHNSARLRKLVPKDVIFVSESGIKNGEDVRKLRDMGVDAVLIGETLMRCADKARMLQELSGK